MPNCCQRMPAPRQPLGPDGNRSDKRRGLPRTALVAVSLTLLTGCANNPILRWISSGQGERHSESSSVEQSDTYDQSNTYDRGYTSGKSYTYAQSYNRDQGSGYDQTSAVDLSRTYGQTDSVREYFTDKADKNDLPQKHLSEAHIGMTEVDVTLGEARATELERDATYRRRSAQLQTRRTEAAAR